MDSLIYLREAEAARLFDVTRVTVFNWGNTGRLRKERKDNLNYYVAKLVIEEDGRCFVECFPETVSKIKRVEINAK